MVNFECADYIINPCKEDLEEIANLNQLEI